MNMQRSYNGDYIYYFGHFYWDGDCILCTKQVVDSGSGEIAVFTGGGLLRWQVKSGSSMRFLEEARRVMLCDKAALL